MNIRMNVEIFLNCVQNFARGMDIDEKFILNTLNTIRFEETLQRQFPVSIDHPLNLGHASSLSKLGAGDNERTCIFIMKGGPRKGLECGKKAARNSLYGRHCSAHIEDEKNISSQLPIKTHDSSSGGDSKIKYVLTLDEDSGYYVFGKTGLVIKSVKEKIIIGKLVDGELQNLSKEDIALCKRCKLRYLKSDKEEKDKEKDKGKGNNESKYEDEDKNKNSESQNDK